MARFIDITMYRKWWCQWNTYLDIGIYDFDNNRMSGPNGSGGLGWRTYNKINVLIAIE
jgi:hypothetical protein